MVEPAADGGATEVAAAAAWPGQRPRKALMLVPEVVLATQQAAAFIKQGGLAPHRCGSHRPLVWSARFN